MKRTQKLWILGLGVVTVCVLCTLASVLLNRVLPAPQTNTLIQNLSTSEAATVESTLSNVENATSTSTPLVLPSATDLPSPTFPLEPKTPTAELQVLVASPEPISSPTPSSSPTRERTKTPTRSPTTTLTKTQTRTATRIATKVPTKRPTLKPVPTIAPTRAPANCDPSYPTVCIPPPPPDLDCGDIPYRNFRVIPPDRHRFDGDHDGIGCER